MADDFSDGWIAFEEFVDNLRSEKHLSMADIDQYIRMYKENNEGEK